MDKQPPLRWKCTVHRIQNRKPLQIARPNGSTRQIRLHDEGIWTIGGKRRAADVMATRIDAWRAVPVAV